MIVERIVVGPLEVNCYVAAQGPGHRAVVIDPGGDVGLIRGALEKHRLTAGCVVNTHGHFDHIGADDEFGVPVYVHRLEEPLLRDGRKNYSAFFGDRSYRVSSKLSLVEDGAEIVMDGVTLAVAHTPGHSPGGICLILKEPVRGIVFTGDSLFRQSIGRTDLGGDEDLLVQGIRDKLLRLPDDTVVYPGHGPESTIGAERLSNPFLA